MIVTATLDPASWSYFEDLRRSHFPPERNVLAAHLTLFHRLPGDVEQNIRANLVEAASTTPSRTGRAVRVRSLGRGVAFDIDCADLVELRGRLAVRWADLLGAQDRAWRQPHVTVQNKVTPEAAAALLRQLQSSFVPFMVEIRGVALWRYLGGPWDLVADIPFAPAA